MDYNLLPRFFNPIHTYNTQPKNQESKKYINNNVSNTFSLSATNVYFVTKETMICYFS
jgi:hypothetical protein